MEALPLCCLYMQCLATYTPICSAPQKGFFGGEDVFLCPP